MRAESEPDRCVTQTRQLGLVGASALEVVLWCEVCVCSPDNLHPHINGIGVAIDVAKMMASDLLI